VYGEHRSAQAERLLARLRRVSRALTEVMRWLTPFPLRRSGSPKLSMVWASRVLPAYSPRGAVHAPRPATPVAGPFFDDRYCIAATVGSTYALAERSTADVHLFGSSAGRRLGCASSSRPGA
jgi:hypothetical protein